MIRAISLLSCAVSLFLSAPSQAKYNDAKTAFDIADKALTSVPLGATQPPKGAKPWDDEPNTCRESNFVFCIYNDARDQTDYAFMKGVMYKKSQGIYTLDAYNTPEGSYPPIAVPLSTFNLGKKRDMDEVRTHMSRFLGGPMACSAEGYFRPYSPYGCGIGLGDGVLAFNFDVNKRLIEIHIQNYEDGP
ncbi:MAG: hypothetical protein ACRCY3_13365 [Sphingorhabdus sp.]